jgi:hypothetical protein
MKCVYPFLVLFSLVPAACAPPPPTLTPPGIVAFQTTRVVKGLDAFRDVAIAANAQTPPLISDATTGKIVRYHQATLLTIQTIPGAWQTTAQTGLTALVATFSPAEQQTLAPYVALVKTVIAEVP